MDKKIAVVILNWNGAKLLEQFLPSVIAYSDEANIYVADNASTDNSIAVIKEQFPSVKIIHRWVGKPQYRSVYLIR
jgi:GT2 family glycosyltransferase